MRRALGVYRQRKVNIDAMPTNTFRLDSKLDVATKKVEVECVLHNAYASNLGLEQGRQPESENEGTRAVSERQSHAQQQPARLMIHLFCFLDDKYRSLKLKVNKEFRRRLLLEVETEAESASEGSAALDIDRHRPCPAGKRRIPGEQVLLSRSSVLLQSQRALSRSLPVKR
jgi:hypothetical protein